MFRAEVVGSLLRPSWLKEARADFQRGELTAAALKHAEDRAVDQAIALQEGAGVDVVTDGEMRRFLFMGPITETVEGIEPVQDGLTMPWMTPEGETEWTVPVAITGKLRKRRSLVAEEYSYARARARQPLKVTVPSPLVMYNMWSPRHSTGAYADPFAMFADAAEVGRSEIEELVSLGCEYVQVDAPELATLVDPRIRDFTESLGMPAERMLTEGIELIDSMVQGISGVRLAIHLCRGNNAGMWMASGGYDDIASALFGRATSFDSYLLEYDDPRSGGFEPLASAPEDRQVVLGLVSTKRSEMETGRGCGRGSTRPRATSRGSSSGYRRSAASRRRRRATRSTRTRRSASCASWPRWRTLCGALARVAVRVRACRIAMLGSPSFLTCRTSAGDRCAANSG